MGILRLLPFLVLTAGQAVAGAWPRGEGNTFLTFSHTLSADPATYGTATFEPEGYYALLAERGLSDRLTFGLDAGLADGGDGSALIYLSRAVGPLDAANRFAVQGGLGMTRYGGGREPFVQIGGSWGRGLDLPWAHGWAAADAALHYRTESAEVAVKLDVTLGTDILAGVKVFVQAQTGLYPDADPYLRLVPSMAWEFAPGRHFEIGVPVDITGGSDAGVKIGTWIAF